MKNHIVAASAAYSWTVMVLITRGIIRSSVYAQRTVFYAHLAWTLGLAPGGSQLAQILGEVAEDDAAKGLPVSTSVVISQRTGMPGPGYFVKVKTLKLLSPLATSQDEEKFWRDQLARLFA